MSPDHYNFNPVTFPMPEVPEPDSETSVVSFRADALRIGMFSEGGVIRDVGRWHGYVLVLWETSHVSAYHPARRFNVYADTISDGGT